MAKKKATITLEPEKVEAVRRITGADSTSAAIDIALDRLIRTERLRQDVLAYAGQRPTEAEIVLAEMTPPWDDLADDTDWEALYSNER